MSVQPPTRSLRFLWNPKRQLPPQERKVFDSCSTFRRIRQPQRTWCATHSTSPSQRIIQAFARSNLPSRLLQVKVRRSLELDRGVFQSPSVTIGQASDCSRGWPPNLQLNESLHINDRRR